MRKPIGIIWIKKQLYSIVYVAYVNWILLADNWNDKMYVWHVWVA